MATWSGVFPTLSCSFKIEKSPETEEKNRRYRHVNLKSRLLFISHLKGSLTQNNFAGICNCTSHVVPSSIISSQRYEFEIDLTHAHFPSRDFKLAMCVIF